MSVCMSAVSAGISEVLIKYTGKYVKIYFIMKITCVCVQISLHKRGGDCRSAKKILEHGCKKKKKERKKRERDMSLLRSLYFLLYSYK